MFSVYVSLERVYAHILAPAKNASPNGPFLLPLSLRSRGCDTMQINAARGRGRGEAINYYGLSHCALVPY